MQRGDGQGFFVTGGTLPSESESYLERSTDQALLKSLIEGKFCYVLNSRQLGKSSLSVRTIGRLRSQGIRTVFIDLTRIGGQTATPEQWYSGIAFEIARELKFFREAVEYWRKNSSQALVQRLFGMIRELAVQSAPLVIFIDEIDATRSLPFDPDEFFAGIRECYNRRSADPDLNRLSFCLIGVGVPGDLVRDRATTPFNIGERIRLDDFTLQELLAYSGMLGPNGREVISRVHYWTGGHPYLTQSLCQALIELGKDLGKREVDAVVKREFFDPKARESNINLSDVANLALHYGGSRHGEPANRADVLTMYGRILGKRLVIDDESNREVVVLKLSGLVTTDGRRLRVRNRIYEQVFNGQWIEENLPAQELRRQQQSYRRGVIRTALVSGAILAVVSGIAAFAWIARLGEIEAEKKLSYQLYVADMSSLRLFYENGDTTRIERILARHKDSPYRGFEWGFWFGRHHDSWEEYTMDYRAAGKRLEGHISSDGTEVCIVDQLTLTATVVNRETKKVLATKGFGMWNEIVPLRSRWAQISLTSPSAFAVDDIKTGTRLCAFDEPDKNLQWIRPADHSDVVAVAGLSKSGPVTCGLSLYNAVSGKRLYSIKDLGLGDLSVTSLARQTVAVSSDGRYVVFPRGPFKPVASDPNGRLLGELVVLEWATNKVVDRIPISQFAENPTRNFDGKRLFFQDLDRATIRDVRTRQSIDWDSQTVRDSHVGRALFSGNLLLTVLDSGKCIVHDMKGVQRDVVREDANWIAPGSTETQYLTGSNSVRLYDDNSPSVSSVVATGRRITRYAPGILNVFQLGSKGLAQLREHDFKVLSKVSLPGTDSYTYSGRWLLNRGTPDTLSAIGVKAPPIQLPISPTLWSCGVPANSIGLWQVGNRQLIGFDGIEHRVRWTRNDVKDVTAIWICPDGSRLLLEQGNRDITVIDMADGHSVGVLRAHNLGPVYVAFSADARTVFTCGGDGTTVMWDLHSARKLMTFSGNDQDGVLSADISPDGRRVVTSTQSGSWQLWDTSNGVKLLEVPVSTTALTSALFIEGGKSIITAGDDSRVQLWRSVNTDHTTYVSLDPARAATVIRQ